MTSRRTFLFALLGTALGFLIAVLPAHGAATVQGSEIITDGGLDIAGLAPGAGSCTAIVRGRICLADEAGLPRVSAASGDMFVITDGGATLRVAGQVLAGNQILTVPLSGKGTTSVGEGNVGLEVYNNGTIGSDGLCLLDGGTCWTGQGFDGTFCVYNAGNLPGATAFGETTFTKSVTVDTSSKITQDVVGVGAGNFVVKVCTDGTTCAAGNTYLTYTEACTAAAGVRTAAVVSNSGTIAVGAVATISVATACATTDPGANVCIHFTRP